MIARTRHPMNHRYVRPRLTNNHSIIKMETDLQLPSREGQRRDTTTSTSLPHSQEEKAVQEGVVPPSRRGRPRCKDLLDRDLADTLRCALDHNRNDRTLRAYYRIAESYILQAAHEVGTQPGINTLTELESALRYRV